MLFKKIDKLIIYNRQLFITCIKMSKSDRNKIHIHDNNEATIVPR